MTKLSHFRLPVAFGCRSDGVRFCTSTGFRRHLFGKWRTYPVNWRAAAQLLALLVTVTALVVINMAIATATSASVLTGGASAWPNRAFLGDLTVDLVIFEVLAVVTLAALWHTYRSHRGYRESSTPPVNSPVVRTSVLKVYAGPRRSSAA